MYQIYGVKKPYNAVMKDITEKKINGEDTLS